jgi:hypothetical protein
MCEGDGGVRLYKRGRMDEAGGFDLDTDDDALLR